MSFISISDNHYWTRDEDALCT